MCLGVVSLVSVAWEGRVVNPTGGNFPISWHKKSSREICNSHYKSCESHRDWSSRLSHLDSSTKSSRDSHHHSTSHILYEHRNLVEIYTSHLDETYQHTHTYLHLVEICAIICTYTSRLNYVRENMIIMLDIDWGNSDRYIHTSTWAWEPHDVLWQFDRWHIT